MINTANNMLFPQNFSVNFSTPTTKMGQQLQQQHQQQLQQQMLTRKLLTTNLPHNITDNNNNNNSTANQLPLNVVTTTANTNTAANNTYSSSSSTTNTNPDNIDQCFSHWFTHTSNPTETAPVLTASAVVNQLKLEDRLVVNECEDSGFNTCYSAQSSPQLSPISNSSYTRMDSTANGSPFDDYTPLSFQGVATSANWSLDAILPTGGGGGGLSFAAKEIKLFSDYPSKSADGSRELRIVKQPEAHHRARYMTEGSRGTIKDRTGRSYPAVQLFGYAKPGPPPAVKMQCFIGHDTNLGQPHLFYQACEVSGKTPYKMTKVDGFNVIELELSGKHQYLSVLDCMGILKERNVDVERKVLRSRRRIGAAGGSNRLMTTASEEAKVIRSTNKARSTHCRLVFRCQLPDTGEILQSISEPILCTQPLGSPEIYKMSTSESDIKGGNDLFIIGKNFHKDSKVVFTGTSGGSGGSGGSAQTTGCWRKVVQPMKEFLNATHLVCPIPGYDGPDGKYQSVISAEVTVHCDHKSSEPIKFIYKNQLPQQQQHQQHHHHSQQQSLLHCQIQSSSTPLMRHQHHQQQHQHQRGKHL
ncbi:nuclear factor of activated T-cells, cytoplasmic 3-like [Oppia nitens]|uniref:nuclear factor of activated T-cells, cytoplasmic 3-like n=1 Tax=Oppia nitens TaxID=1686743 RepID=UPI0023D9F695|nr:nuclear factor of activated T-cells, cytoplasmic 3-like [Oppia nitens]